MGIEGLVNALDKSVKQERHIAEFANKTAAVDASIWLYHGAYSCAVELARNVKTTKFLHYSLKSIAFLKRFNITPYIVFDGSTVPLKKHTVNKRSEERQKRKEAGDSLYDEGKICEAAKVYQGAITVQYWMVTTLIDVLEKLKIKYIVAPYEADAEIAYLVKEKLADFALTTDSDLLVYGCDCIVSHLDINTGICKRVIKINEEIRNRRGLIADPFTKTVGGFSEDTFIELCILAGCDYLNNISKFGIKKALQLLADGPLESGLIQLNSKGPFAGKVPENYLKNIQICKLQFKHGIVIDPRTMKMIYFDNKTTIEGVPKEDLMELGEIISDRGLVEQIAKGLYDLKQNKSRVRLSNEELDKIIPEAQKFEMICFDPASIQVNIANSFRRESDEEPEGEAEAEGGNIVVGVNSAVNILAVAPPSVGNSQSAGNNPLNTGNSGTDQTNAKDAEKAGVKSNAMERIVKWKSERKVSKTGVLQDENNDVKENLVLRGSLKRALMEACQEEIKRIDQFFGVLDGIGAAANMKKMGGTSRAETLVEFGGNKKVCLEGVSEEKGGWVSMEKK